MKILETRSTRWMSANGSMLRKRVIDTFSDNYWRHSIDVHMDYIEETESNGSTTVYLCTAFFFRYSPYAILVWQDFLNNPKSEYSRIFKLSKVVSGEGDPVYCEEQFYNVLEDNGAVTRISHDSFKLESCVLKLVQLNCIDEARDVINKDQAKAL